MSRLFLNVVNLSITASLLILLVIILRQILKKAPKWMNGILWGFVAIRLICPFSFESTLSMMPSHEMIMQDSSIAQNLTINADNSSTGAGVNSFIEQDFTLATLSHDHLWHILLSLATFIWCVGMIVMWIYAFIYYFKVKNNVAASVIIRDHILACDEVESPFTLGVIRPKIYIPSSLSGETLECVIIHEQAHIIRHDHWWKPLGYLLLTIHWFNPLCWMAYTLFCRDIEMACDEKAIHQMDKKGRALYAQALLDCNMPIKKIVMCPLAFGEIGVKERVKLVISYKQPSLWIKFITFVVCMLVAVCFMTNRRQDANHMLIDAAVEQSVAHEMTIALKNHETGQIQKNVQISDKEKNVLFTEMCSGLSNPIEDKYSKAFFDSISNHEYSFYFSRDDFEASAPEKNSTILIECNGLYYEIEAGKDEWQRMVDVLAVILK